MTKYTSKIDKISWAKYELEVFHPYPAPRKKEKTWPTQHQSQHGKA